MATKQTLRRTGWFLVWVAVMLLILALVPGNTLAYGAAVAAGLFGAVGWAHLRASRR